MINVNLGQLVATPGFLSTGINPVGLLERHQKGDWGSLDKEDKKANDEALKHGGRLLSAYKVGGIKVWVITEWDRSVTTLLLPEEY